MRENRSSGFPTRPVTNRPVQSQKQARTLKFRFFIVEEGLHYPCSENKSADFCLCDNKGADQLRSNCEADPHLCFRIDKNPVFSQCGSLGGEF